MYDDLEKYLSVKLKKVFNEYINSQLAIRQDSGYGIYVSISMKDFCNVLNRNKVAFTKEKYGHAIKTSCSLKIPEEFTKQFRYYYACVVDISSTFKFNAEINGKVSREESYLIAEKESELWMEESTLTSQRIGFLDGHSAYIFFNFLISFCPYQILNKEIDNTGDIISIDYLNEYHKINVWASTKIDGHGSVYLNYSTIQRSKDEESKRAIKGFLEYEIKKIYNRYLHPILGISIGYHPENNIFPRMDKEYFIQEIKEFSNISFIQSKEKYIVIAGVLPLPEDLTESIQNEYKIDVVIISGFEKKLNSAEEVLHFQSIRFSDQNSAKIYFNFLKNYLPLEIIVDLDIDEYEQITHIEFLIGLSNFTTIDLIIEPEQDNYSIIIVYKHE